MGASTLTAHLPPSVIDPNATMYDRYFQTAYERMAVFHRRFIEKRGQPWTTDPALDKFSFTNVHRHMDRGTIFYKQNILEPMTLVGGSDGDVLAATIAYRWFNRVETWERSLGPSILAGRFDIREIEERLRTQKQSGDPPFTAATMVCAYDGKPGRDKVERVCLMLGDHFEKREQIAGKLKAARRPQGASDVLEALDGIGPFIAYEFYSDLLYAGQRFFPWDEDAWANVGPGAKKGLKLIFPTEPPSRHLDLLRKLRDEQEAAFDRLGLDFSEISPEGQRMTMRSCEHWTCEFQKYVRGNTKRKFVPQTRV